jgi:Zn-dependent protease with chaperone function
MQLLRGRWFDGRSSRAQPVAVLLLRTPQGPALQLRPLADASAPPVTIPNDQVGWPEAWSAARAPKTVVVDLGMQGSLEVDDVAAWRATLAEAGVAAPLAERMQTRWRVFLAVLAVAALGLFAFYRWGTPWAAVQITRHVPLAWEASLTERAMQDLDGRWLKPSKLPAERQAQLRARFDALARQVTPPLRRYGSYAPPLQLHFRSGFGPNAFALPGGTIVITDGLVELAAQQGLPDDAVVGVLAHEIGHVVHRHTTRLVVEQGVLNIGLGLALGDVSSIVSIGSSMLTGLAYRRSHETEADCFAVALMKQAGLATQPMADLLLALEKTANGGERGSGVLTLLSSHPDTHDRALELKEGKTCLAPSPARGRGPG